jgi:hypothetical protein
VQMYKVTQRSVQSLQMQTAIFTDQSVWLSSSVKNLMIDCSPISVILILLPDGDRFARLILLPKWWDLGFLCNMKWWMSQSFPHDLSNRQRTLHEEFGEWFSDLESIQVMFSEQYSLFKWFSHLSNKRWIYSRKLPNSWLPESINSGPFVCKPSCDQRIFRLNLICPQRNRDLVLRTIPRWSEIFRTTSRVVAFERFWGWFDQIYLANTHKTISSNVFCHLAIHTNHEISTIWILSTVRDIQYFSNCETISLHISQHQWLSRLLKREGNRTNNQKVS